MNFSLVTNALVSLIMGSALLLLWRRDPRQSFTRYLGLSSFLDVAVSAGFGLYIAESSIARAAGAVLMVASTAGYATLMLIGIAHLAERHLARKTIFVVFGFLGTVSATSMALEAAVVGQFFNAAVNTLLGLLALGWLWSRNARHATVYKLIGLLLTAMGLDNFISLGLDLQAVALQATVDSLLRVTLALALFYAALVRSNAQNKRLRERFERLSENSRQGILIRQGRKIVYANPACYAIYGIEQHIALTGQVLAQTLPEAERAANLQRLDLIQSGKLLEDTHEFLCHQVNGTPIWLHFHAFRTQWGDAPAVQILITNDTERHNATEALLHQALHDDLTGLPNRAALMQSLRKRCDGGDGDVPFVLILMDIDRFKLFNEAHGHSVGDEVLKAFGQALRAALDDGHEVMRLGEDEYAVIGKARTDGDTAVLLTTQIRQLLSEPLAITGREFFLDASIGIALYPHSARNAEALLRAANAAMHVAKRTPGTSHKLAEKEFERGSSNTLENEQALRLGIDRHEFHLVYQPKVDSHSGRLTSFEALARWQRPGVGLVSPVEFIGAAERTGLIGALGTLLLRQACQQIAVWHQQFGACVPVAVNVSPQQMLDPEFPQLVERVMQETGVQASWMSLEITESSAMQNLDQTTLQIAQLRALGVQVAMDDFGTGFSSLNMLRALRLHTIKIDKGLIDPLPEPEAIAVVTAICQLARALGMHVVAEGIETQAQAQAARDAGCDELQGYLYARPLPAADAGDWLQRAAS